jgi:hypothetical protein
MDGRRLPHSRAELIHAPWGWQVELYDVPPDRCPLLRQIGGLRLKTVDDQWNAGTAIADLVSDDGSFVLLGGIGRLRLMASADAA